jgi:hypothetical protein
MLSTLRTGHLYLPGNISSSHCCWSRDSSVGIATRYGLEGPGFESRWGEIFRNYPDRLRGPSSLLYNGYRSFPGGKGGRGVVLTTHPLLVPRLRKSWAIPPLTLWVLLGLLRGSLLLAAVRGWVDSRTIVLPEGLSQLKVPMTPSGIAAQCLNQLAPQRAPKYYLI